MLFFYVGPGNRTQIVRLGGMPFTHHLLGHPTTPASLMNQIPNPNHRATVSLNYSLRRERWVCCAGWTLTTALERLRQESSQDFKAA